MTTFEAATVLSTFHQLLSIAGANTFRINAIKKAVKTLKAYELTVDEFLAKKISGIGKQIQESLLEIQKTGSLRELDELKNDYPITLLEVAAVKGIGPKKVKQLFEELEVSSAAELRAAAEEGKISELRGFGKKSIQEMLASLDFLDSVRNKFLIDAHEEALHAFLNFCSAKKLHSQPEPIHNSLEKEEVFEFVELAASSKDRHEIIELALNKNYEVDESSKNFIVCSRDSIPVKVFFNTQSPTTKNASRLSRNLLGILHAHSDYSDGFFSVEEMAEACIELGASYFGISDHSQSAKYAGGLNPIQVKNQQREIDRVNKRLAPFRVLKGIESDIKSDGSLDYDNATLSSFDFVIASIHSGFEMLEEEMTERICRAIKHKATRILAHPSGRLLLKREGYQINYEKIFKTAAESRVIIEINANPQRLDIDWRNIGMAKEMGIKFCISPDAHNIPQLKYIEYGLLIAEKAGLREEDLINYLPVDTFLKTNGYG